MISYESMTGDKGWFSMTPILSYGRHLNVITGKRSTGKSTGAALYVLMAYMKGEGGWIYSRRTKDETDLTCASWFDNAVDILKMNGVEVEVRYAGGKYFVNGNEAGRAIPLSLQQKTKGDNLSAFNNFIIYDEFISFDGRYLGGQNNPIFEYQALMSLYQTADRTIGSSHTNKCKIICLGNNDTYYNPVYMAIGADKHLRTDTHFLAPKGEEWVVEQLRASDAEQAEDYKNSISYKLSDERTKAYAYENENKEKMDGDFIEKRTKPMKGICDMVYDGVRFGVYLDEEDGICYLSSKSTKKKTLALTAKDHTPNYTLLRGYMSNVDMKFVNNMYIKGKVRFENGRLKYYLDNYLHYVV